MSVLYLVVPLAMLFVIAAILTFVWSARHGQFDDLDTPALRALHDDAAPRRPAPTATASATDPEPERREEA